MDAKGLMIGDWVLKPSKEDIESLYYGKIEPDDFYLEEEWETISNCEPIPLTPEILEKNGFKKQFGNEWSYYKYKDDDIHKASLYNVLWNMDEEYLEIHSFTNKTGDFSCIGNCYVHTLQHALRLCGIEKEIEL